MNQNKEQDKGIAFKKSINALASITIAPAKKEETFNTLIRYAEANPIKAKDQDRGLASPLEVLKSIFAIRFRF